MSADRTKEDAGPLRERVLRILLPITVLAALVLGWHAVVQVYAIPPYVLPGPLLVFSTLVSDWAVLWGSLLVTLATTLEGFLLAAFGGIALAVLFNQSLRAWETRPAPRPVPHAPWRCRRSSGVSTLRWCRISARHG